MLNKVILMGRLTADPEIRMSQSNKEVMSFSIAVNRRFKRDETDFINCVAWEKTAKFIHTYFRKGQLINVCGSLQTRTWDDAHGNKRYSTEVIVNEVNFCGESQQNGTTQNDPLNDVVNAIGGTQFPQQFTPVEDDGNLPL